jgi:hypothetical protein
MTATKNKPLTYYLEASNPIKAQISEIFVYLDSHPQQTEGALYSLKALEKVLAQALSDTRRRIRKLNKSNRNKSDYF